MKMRLIGSTSARFLIGLIGAALFLLSATAEADEFDQFAVAKNAFEAGQYEAAVERFELASGPLSVEQWGRWLEVTVFRVTAGTVTAHLHLSSRTPCGLASVCHTHASGGKWCLLLIRLFLCSIISL